MSVQMITANRLHDGIVVYQAKGGAWATRFAEGELLQDKAAADAALAVAEEAVKARQVVSVYLIDVAVEEGVPQPTNTREYIRASGGPTIEAEVGSWTGRIGD
ncbi:MAG: DUF2849 domain-containing protein [Dongiaceae bacterium]